MDALYVEGPEYPVVGDVTLVMSIKPTSSDKELVTQVRFDCAMIIPEFFVTLESSHVIVVGLVMSNFPPVHVTVEPLFVSVKSEDTNAAMLGVGYDAPLGRG